MCFFPLSNLNFNSVAYRKGVVEFDCGSCPECLRKRSNIWALRSVYESKSHAFNCMITLTYDNFVRDPKTGKILGETPVDPNLEVNKRDVQLFIKRLRKWYSTFSSEKIKYIACAEYGTRTHRAHYHLILFGVKFPDIHFYKKSKRGNIIYMSNILTRLWNHGICTVDSISVHSAIARYCTKYCAKSRSDNTFMLCSQMIGFAELLKDFNGRSYIIDGREYPIPRFIWQYVIFERYKYVCPSMSFKYLNKHVSDEGFIDNYSDFETNVLARSLYRAVRDSDLQYSQYLDYWHFKGSSFEQNKLDSRFRILQLDDSKFHFYKIAALNVFDKFRKRGVPFPAPGSNCVSSYFRYIYRIYRKFGISYKITCPYPSRPNRASDTNNVKLIQIFDKSPFKQKNIQISLDI